MQKMESKEKFIWMKDFYAPLLTVHQREILTLYLDSDYTFTEIAETFGSTRQAIYDMVKRTEKILIGYEEKLKLLERFYMTRQKVEQVGQLVVSLPGDEIQKKEIFQVLDEILAIL